MRCGETETIQNRETGNGFSDAAHTSTGTPKYSGIVYRICKIVNGLNRRNYG